MVHGRWRVTKESKKWKTRPARVSMECSPTRHACGPTNIYKEITVEAEATRKNKRQDDDSQSKVKEYIYMRIYEKREREREG